MLKIYFVLLFGIFIIISNFICKNIKDRKSANIKSILSSIGSIVGYLVIVWIAKIMLNMVSETAMFISYFIDVIFVIGLMLFNIYLISKFFRYNISFPYWVLLVSIICAIIAYPIYIVRLKAILDSINMLFLDESISAFTFLDILTSNKYSGKILDFFVRMPSIVLSAFLIVKKIYKKD